MDLEKLIGTGKAHLQLAREKRESEANPLGLCAIQILGRGQQFADTLRHFKMKDHPTELDEFLELIRSAVIEGETSTLDRAVKEIQS